MRNSEKISSFCGEEKKNEKIIQANNVYGVIQRVLDKPRFNIFIAN